MPGLSKGMSLSILAAAAAAAVQPVTTQARVTMRVLQAAKVTEDEWKAARRQTDRIIHDELGREVRLRTIDFE